MTDHDEPTNDEATSDDATWFLSHVGPVVDGEVPDAWDEIQSRATGRHPILIPLPTSEPRPWPGRRLVAVAALLLVTVGMVGLGMKLVGSDDNQRPAWSARARSLRSTATTETVGTSHGRLLKARRHRITMR